MAARRQVLLGGVSALAASAFGLGPVRARGEGSFPVMRSEAEWRKVLTPAQYRILRQDGTERAGSSPLDREKRAGVFSCAGCGQALFRSRDKYDSGTGWPSFTSAIGGSVGLAQDMSLGTARTEVHCARCGGHHGHVFNDGPAPTGKRWCMNGAVLRFTPGASA